jgi:hypothetical protein
MDILPRADEAVIPMRKLTEYALDIVNNKDKAFAFKSALGYNPDNAEKLYNNIKDNLTKFPAISKGNNGYGERYEVTLYLIGVNGKQAKVLTGWIDDPFTGEMRLTTVHIDK